MRNAWRGGGHAGAHARHEQSQTRARPTRMERTSGTRTVFDVRQRCAPCQRRAALEKPHPATRGQSLPRSGGLTRTLPALAVNERRASKTNREDAMNTLSWQMKLS